VRAVSGLVTVASGVLVTVLAATALVRATRGWRKLLALPAGIATLLLIVAPITMAVFVTNAPPFDALSSTPADRGLVYEDVSITTADDVRLTGYYVPSENGASIVLLGGISGLSERELDFAQLLAGHGYGALLLNVRGQGESEGDFVLWGWWGEVDVAAGVDYLVGRPDVDPGRIGAIGMSVGGEQAISAAGVDHRLRAVVSEGASARGARDEGDRAEGSGGWLIRYIDWVTRNAAALMTAADQPTPLRDSLAALDGQRALIISAGTRPQEVAAAEEFRRSAPDAVEVWIAPDASHTGAYTTHPDEWEDRVITFLDDALRPGG
jgi:dienelactone hydrolase